jgi:signal transduction histidine kinase
MALKKSITIQNEVDKNLKIESDRYMLSLIINNLLTNAIKFTHQNGFVKISCETQKDNFIQVCISDTGVGISENAISNLFKIDKSISTEGTNQEKGTGLGLLLCKEFIDVLGGDIWAESSEGKGSKFYFTIKQ